MFLNIIIIMTIKMAPTNLTIHMKKNHIQTSRLANVTCKNVTITYIIVNPAKSPKIAITITIMVQTNIQIPTGG